MGDWQTRFDLGTGTLGASVEGQEIAAVWAWAHE